MKKETVYMAQLGENYEGVLLTSLHHTLEGAITKAKAWMADSSFTWEGRESYPTHLRSWEGGCDYIIIFEQEIED